MLHQIIKLFPKTFRRTNIIGIHPCHKICILRNLGEEAVSGFYSTEIFRVAQHPNARISGGVLPQDMQAPVIAAVITDDQLKIPMSLVANGIQALG